MGAKQCLWCPHTSPTASAHGIHLGTAHADRMGVGVADRTQRTRRTWSCWSCATENPPTTSTCLACGWAHPNAPKESLDTAP